MTPDTPEQQTRMVFERLAGELPMLTERATHIADWQRSQLEDAAKLMRQIAARM